jgi:hypothetical protein
MNEFHSKAGHAALLFFLCSSSVLAAEDSRLPIPNKAAQEKLRQLARDIYQEDYAAAKSAEQKSVLAKQIISSAHDKRDDATARFVLLKLGQDIAVLGGDVAVAFDAADSLCKLYQLDELETKASLLGRLSKTVRVDTQHGLLADRMLPLIDGVVLADEYDRAQKLTTVLVRHAKRSKKTARIKTALAKEAEVQKITGAYRRIASDLATLEADPVNAAANSAVGRFYCFVKGDWATGVPMLALGGKDKLEALARVEIAKDELSADDRVAAGDTLWKLASDPEHERYVDVLKERARFHYRKALADVDGLVKDKIEKRIKVVEKVNTDTPQVAQDKGLELHYTFDKINGRRVEDASGNGRHGAILGNPRWLKQGRVGGALALGGIGHCVRFPAIGPANAVTYAAWIYPAQPNVKMVRCLIYDDGEADVVGKVQFQHTRGLIIMNTFGVAYRPPGVGSHVLSRSVVGPGRWIHVAITYDNELRQGAVYIDGRLDGAATCTNKIAMHIGPGRIGAWNKFAKHQFIGGIDDVRIYSRALAAEEFFVLAQRKAQ